MSTADKIFSEPETRMVLENVAWDTFVELAYRRRGSIPRMSYDNGVLEMMSPKREHENIGRLVGRMVEAYSEIKDIEIISLASVTVKRSDLSKAFEADESYYVAHAVELLSKTELDFDLDPPPDLVIEVELTSSAIKKMDLFADIGVPEVWRHDGRQLCMYSLAGGTYAPIESSLQLPSLDSRCINENLELRGSIGETKLIQQFRKRFS